MTPELADLVLRRKGRQKLKMLMREATEICLKYAHSEYAGDFKQIHDGLMHDGVVECPTLNTPDKEANR